MNHVPAFYKNSSIIPVPQGPQDPSPGTLYEDSLCSRSLCPYSCNSSHQFTDHTSLMGPTSGGDEPVFRWEIDHLVTVGLNNAELNNVTRVGMVVDIRKNAAPLGLITLL